MNRRIVLSVVGVVALAAVLALANPFAREERPLWSDIVLDTRAALGVQPSGTVFTQDDIARLHPIFLNNGEAEALWNGLADLGGQARSAVQLTSIRGIGPSATSKILLFFDLDMDGWDDRRS